MSAVNGRQWRCRGILLHEAPDLDAVFASWLLRRFGGEKYPGVEAAPVLFYPVHTLPGGLSAEALEGDGILPVDTGLGRLDNHAAATPTSSAMLVAQDLGVAGDPALKKALEFVHRNDVEGRGMRSTDPTDHAISLPSILRGLQLRYQQEPGRVVEMMHVVLDGIHAAEEDWVKALADFERATTRLMPNGVKVVGMSSAASAAMRVGRLNKADVVIHHHTPSGTIGITLTRHGKADRAPWLRPVAVVLRAAELLAEGSPMLPASELEKAGLVSRWFLHDSLFIVSNGSPKNPVVPQSRLGMATIVDLVGVALCPEVPLPEPYCDSNVCRVRCRLAELGLANCAQRSSAQGGTSDSRET